MAWVKVPPENHSKFYDALPNDPRVEPMKMFGGVAAKVNGRIFGGLFGRSVMLWLPEPDRAEALALEGASPFDPMGDGRASDKVMLPERVMNSPPELRAWLRRAFEATAALPPKAAAKATAPGRAKARTAKGSAKPPRTTRKASGIDAYLAQVDPATRKALQKLRKTIRSIVPKAEEIISYKIPAFRVGDRIVGGFSATRKGASYFPFSGRTLRTLARELRGYNGTKSALHFDPKQGLPAALVRKLLAARMAEDRPAGKRRAKRRNG